MNPLKKGVRNIDPGDYTYLLPHAYTYRNGIANPVGVKGIKGRQNISTLRVVAICLPSRYQVG